MMRAWEDIKKNTEWDFSSLKNVKIKFDVFKAKKSWKKHVFSFKKLKFSPRSIRLSVPHSKYWCYSYVIAT